MGTILGFGIVVAFALGMLAGQRIERRRVDKMFDLGGQALTSFLGALAKGEVEIKRELPK